MTAQKLRLAEHLDPDTHIPIQSRNGFPPSNVSAQDSSNRIRDQTAVDVERDGQERRRHSSITSSDSCSVHSYSSCTVQSAPDERPQSPDSVDEVVGVRVEPVNTTTSGDKTATTRSEEPDRNVDKERTVDKEEKKR